MWEKRLVEILLVSNILHKCRIFSHSENIFAFTVYQHLANTNMQMLLVLNIWVEFFLVVFNELLYVLPNVWQVPNLCPWICIPSGKSIFRTQADNGFKNVFRVLWNWNSFQISLVSTKCLGKCYTEMSLLVALVCTGFWNWENCLQIYGLSGTNPLPVGHMSPQPGSPGYTMMRGYLMPGPHMVQYHRPNVSGAITDGTTTAMQIPYHSGIVASIGAWIHFSSHLNLQLHGFEHWNNERGCSSGIVMPSPGQPQIAVRSHLPQFPQGSGSNQMSGWIAGGGRRCTISSFILNL